MRKKKGQGTGAKLRADAAHDTSYGLSEAGRARRDFLGSLGKRGAALTVLGLSAETAMQVLLKRSALASAIAAGPAYEDVPEPPEPTTGAIHWVGTDGSDSNAGNELAPFATVQKALDKCRSGDVIYVKAGIYVSTQILWKKSGVILRGAPGTTRDQVILERSGGGSGNIILMDSNRTAGGDPPVEDCQIYGLTLQGGPALADTTDTTARSNNWRKEGIRVRGYVRNLRVFNCVIRHCYNRGFFVGNPLPDYHADDFPHNIEFAYNDCYLNGTDGAGADVSLGGRAGFAHIHHNELHGDIDGIVSVNNHVGSLIEYNHIHDHRGPNNDGRFPAENGIDLKDCHTDNPLLPTGHTTIIRNNSIHGHHFQPGITFQNGSQRAEIYGNDIYDNFVGFLIQRGGSDYGFETGGDVTFANNDVHDNHSRGLVIGSGYHTNITYDNNKIYDNGNREVRTTTALRAGTLIGNGQNVTFTNNIVSNNGRLSNNIQHYFGNLAQVENVTMNNNTYYLPDSSFKVARVKDDRYSLREWQSMFGQDRNSTENSMRYQPASPPQSPGKIDVSDSGNSKEALI